MPKQQKRKYGRPAKQPEKRWALISLDEAYEGQPDLIVREIGSGLFKPDGSRYRSFVEVAS